MRSEKRTRDTGVLGAQARPRAGGALGDATRGRLRRLIAARGESQAAFARACKVESPRVTEWLAGAQLPSAEHLRAIAGGTGVSLDWLLLGEGGDEPRYRGQSLTQSELETDLAAAVVRGLGAPKLPADLQANEWARAGALCFGYCPDVDAAGVLRDAIGRAQADRDRLFERCCDVLRVVVAGWPLVEERFNAFTASLPGLSELAQDAATLAGEVVPVLQELRVECGDHMPGVDVAAALEQRMPGISDRIELLFARWRALPLGTDDPIRHARALLWRQFRALWAGFSRKEGNIGLPTAATLATNRQALLAALNALATEADAQRSFPVLRLAGRRLNPRAANP